MSYQEKKTIASMIGGVPVLIAYSIYAFMKLQGGGPEINDLSFWAISMLLFMGIGVVIAVLTQIIFHIAVVAGFEIKRQISSEISKRVAKEQPQGSPITIPEELDYSEFEIEDEMDKVIALKAMRIGYIIAGAGFLIALITLAFKMPAPIMLNFIFFTFNLATLSESMAHLYYYKRGI